MIKKASVYNFDPTQPQWQSFFSSCRKVAQRQPVQPNQILYPWRVERHKWHKTVERILGIKRNNLPPKVTWSITWECAPYNSGKRKCYLCLNEKLEINSYKGNKLLNKRSKLINKCRYQELVPKFFIKVLTQCSCKKRF